MNKIYIGILLFVIFCTGCITLYYILPTISGWSTWQMVLLEIGIMIGLYLFGIIMYRFVEDCNTEINAGMIAETNLVEIVAYDNTKSRNKMQQFHKAAVIMNDDCIAKNAFKRSKSMNDMSNIPNTQNIEDNIFLNGTFANKRNSIIPMQPIKNNDLITRSNSMPVFIIPTHNRTNMMRRESIV